ncbi:hypothetical protein [Phyllobacterium sophorae]|nr:hypothetical protein [Phyllobacterium sophorae]
MQTKRVVAAAEIVGETRRRMDKIVGEVGDLKTHIATIIEQVKDSK